MDGTRAPHKVTNFVGDPAECLLFRGRAEPYCLVDGTECLLFSGEGVRRNALRVLCPKSPHSEEIARYIE